MRNRFDELAKQIGEAALAPCGITTTQERLTPETLFADLRHEPLPDRDAERDRLGLLGRLASCACIIEAFSRAPSPEDFRACVVKHLVFWQQRARRSDLTSSEEPPRLWMIAAGAPRSLLDALPFVPAPGWPPGIYLLGHDVLRIGLVVASELEAEPETLLVRLMAAGRLLATAIPELYALPDGAHARTVAEPVLLQLQHVLERTPSPTPDEQEIITVMHKSLAEVRREARQEGRQEGRIDVLRKLLAVKFGPLTPEAEAGLAAASPDDLERYLERILTADSLGAVFGT